MIYEFILEISNLLRMLQEQMQIISPTSSVQTSELTDIIFTLLGCVIVMKIQVVNTVSIKVTAPYSEWGVSNKKQGMAGQVVYHVIMSEKHHWQSTDTHL